MALYWPSKKVALDIVDDPGRRPFDGDEDEWTVVRVTCAELEDYDSYRKVMNRLATLLGSKTPTGEVWEQKNRELHSMLLAQGA